GRDRRRCGRIPPEPSVRHRRPSPRTLPYRAGTTAGPRTSPRPRQAEYESRCELPLFAAIGQILGCAAGPPGRALSAGTGGISRGAVIASADIAVIFIIVARGRAVVRLAGSVALAGRIRLTGPVGGPCPARRG